MSIETLNIRLRGGEPEVEVFFGQAQVGRYTIELLDDFGDYVHQIAKGTNTDRRADIFPVGVPASQLKDYFLSWSLDVLAPDSRAGQQYYAKLIIRQDGEVVKTLEYKGQIDGVKVIFGLGTFV